MGYSAYSTIAHKPTIVVGFEPPRSDSTSTNAELETPGMVSPGHGPPDFRVAKYVGHGLNTWVYTVLKFKESGTHPTLMHPLNYSNRTIFTRISSTKKITSYLITPTRTLPSNAILITELQMTLGLFQGSYWQAIFLPPNGSTKLQPTINVNKMGGRSPHREQASYLRLTLAATNISWFQVLQDIHYLNCRRRTFSEILGLLSYKQYYTTKI